MSEELVKRIAALERELAELKAQLLKPEEEPFVPRPMPKYDPTANFTMPASAVKAMCGVVGEMKDRASLPDTRRPSYSEPGGFGPKPGSTREPQVQRGSGWVDPTKLEGRINEDQIKKRWSK